ncbi:MAG: hypothetical protein ACK4NA_07365 [Alphaproteobacteria bacterium]
MNIYQINRKLMPASSVCRIGKRRLKLDVAWPGGDKHISRDDDLSEVIEKYAEDHGCIALCYSPKFPDELIWHETTRFSYAERMPSNRSYTSIMEIGLSVNDTPNARGRHNAASPAWVLKQRLGATPFLYLLTPVRGCSVEDAIVVFHGADNEPGTPEKNRTTHDILVDGKRTSPPPLPSLKMFLETWLPIGIDGPGQIDATTSADFHIAAPEGATVHLEATAGIINRSQARNGQRFTLDTRGLDAGDHIEIRAGYKFWSGVSSKTIVLI